MKPDDAPWRAPPGDYEPEDLMMCELIAMRSEVKRWAAEAPGPGRYRRVLLVAVRELNEVGRCLASALKEKRDASAE